MVAEFDPGPLASPPAVSVLLPTHNRADVVGFALRSVLAQTFADIEVLVCGDGCTDGTAGVVDSFKDPRVRWFDLPKTPAFGYANRNLVLAQARGRFVAMMTHDDLWFPDHLALILPFFDDGAIDLAYSRPLWVSNDGLALPAAQDLDDGEAFAAFMAKMSNSVPSTCFVCRRDALEAAGRFDESLPIAGDLDLWVRILRRAGDGRKAFAYQPVPTSLHFKAAWREDAVYSAPEMTGWVASGGAALAAPAALRIEPAPGASIQAAAWEQIESGGSDWLAALRRATIAVLDHRVRDANVLEAAQASLVAVSQHLADEVAASKAEAESWVSERDALRTKVALLRGDTELLASQLGSLGTEVEDLRTAVAAREAEVIHARAAIDDMAATLEGERRRPGYQLLEWARRRAAALFPEESWRGKMYTALARYLASFD